MITIACLLIWWIIGIASLIMYAGNTQPNTVLIRNRKKK